MEKKSDGNYTRMKRAFFKTNPEASPYTIVAIWPLTSHLTGHSSGGARGVMVIVVGNGHDDTSSNLGRD